MNVSASGLSKILLQVIPRDFSKFSPVKIRPFFQRSRSPLSHPRRSATSANLAITPRWSLVSPELRVRPWLKFMTKARLPKWRQLLAQVYIVRQDADAKMTERSCVWLSTTIQLSLARFRRRAIRCLPPQFRLDKKIEIAIHHCLDITRFRAGPMVLHRLVRLKDV